MNHIIYHDHCNDGFAAAIIARLSLGTHSCMMYPASYGKSWTDYIPTSQPEDEIYILDFSFQPQEILEMCSSHKQVTWLDHHKTAIDAWYDAELAQPDNLAFDLNMKHSGAMLTWLWFNRKIDPNVTVEEAPIGVKMIDDRDRWVFAIPQTKAFHAGLNLIPKDWFDSDAIFSWENALEFYTSAEYVWQDGAVILSYQEKLYAELATNARKVTINGYEGLACNAPGQFASDIGHILAKRSGTFGLVWQVDGMGNYKFSIRSEGDFDVSKLAGYFGGGGHKNAAGFSIGDGNKNAWGFIEGF